jgi:hypothetical protein
MQEEQIRETLNAHRRTLQLHLETGTSGLRDIRKLARCAQQTLLGMAFRQSNKQIPDHGQ